MSTTRRRTILIDQAVQGALVLRVIAYWLYCQLSVTVMVFAWTVYHGPRRSLGAIQADLLENFLPGILASLLLLPIVMVDMVRFSQLFVGPVHRLKSGLHRLARGEHVQPLQLRQKDFWPDLAASFNTVLSKMPMENEREGTGAVHVDRTPEEAFARVGDTTA